MTSDAPTASWHPAMMPNSAAEAPRNHPQAAPPSPTSSPAQKQPEATDDTQQPGHVDQASGDHDTGAGTDGWFPDYGTTNTDWMKHTDDAPAPAAEPEPAPEPAPAEDSAEPAAEETATEEAAAGTTTASKHLSTMSFTRTVSSEMTWNDDDDVEWDISQPAAQPDPFKFLPDTGRTNSFPNTAHLEQQPTPGLEQPLPATEAEDLIREIEQEEAAENAADAGFDNQFGEHNDHQYIGGNIAGATEAAQEARFDEGLPLISSNEQTAPQPAENGSVGDDLFGADGEGEEDDFFSNVKGNETGQQDGFEPQPLQWKSTMDVLSSLNVGSTQNGFVPLEGTLEEHETESDMLQSQEAQESKAETSTASEDEPKTETQEDLDAKWKEMFGDEEEEEFLLDEETEPKQEVDAAAFLGSDDESLLDDETDIEPTATSGYQPAPVTAAPVTASQHLPQGTPAVSPYAPTGSSATPTQANPYLPPAPAFQPAAVTPYGPPATAPPAQNFGYGAPSPPVQEKPKAESFVDKGKGGYTSPYDLPMEVVKPKKRASALPLQRNTSAPIVPGPAVLPPPRSASLQQHHPIAPPLPSSGLAGPSVSRPESSGSAQGHAPLTARKTSQDAFFEDLPITTKPRPASRHSNKSLPSPSQTIPYEPSSHSAPPYPVLPPVNHQMVAPPGPFSPTGSQTEIPALVAPPKVNPYAALPSSAGLTPAPAPATSTRYSPAPPGGPQQNGQAPPPVLSRYSPAPPARQASGTYPPHNPASAPPILPHQPRTSSPLAHFEITNERSRPHQPTHLAESTLAERRSVSSLHDSRLQRVPSLPPTREVEEEDGPTRAQQFSPGRSIPPLPMSPPDSKYAPSSLSARQTPPPTPYAGQAILSPPKRAMSTHSSLVMSPEFAPPPRSQTQSPGALYGNRGAKPGAPLPRPSSVQDLTSPHLTGYAPPGPVPAAPASSSSRPRGFSLNMNVIPPTDGREHDPLQRWRGAPLLSWGVGGAMVTMFPKEVPRYGMNQSVPSVVRSPGEVKVKNAKDITPLEERLTKFPGPLKGKSKKKEALAWLNAGIETLESGLPNTFGIQSHLAHEDKRTFERVLLWKILRVFIENDGVLEGNPTVEKAVRDLLSPPPTTDAAVPYLNGGASLGLSSSPATSMRTDSVDSATVENIRQHLLSGDSEKAIWAAADQRLWGHALLLANALAPNLYKQVAHEFVKKEVNFPGQNNESLAALYEVLSGNHDETVDELVPVHARAGLQLVAKEPSLVPSKDAMEGLDKWRETLSLILSNRSVDDAKAINSLGVLLSGYGRAEAAHICFMFARHNTIFGGFDDPNSHFVLVGSDHKRQAEQFAKEIEPLLLSEVYEYGQSLAGGSNVAVSNPHLAAYKLQHAYALAEYGFRDKALQYCEVIAAAITAQTKRSPYHHHILENAVEDLMKRLRSAPKEESNSWIPKPSMNKVSDSMWNRFNKFVAGDDNDEAGQGSAGDAIEAGPFGRIAGGTPTISRSPSTNNLETFGAAIPSYGMPVAPVPNGPVAFSAPPTRAASRYAPGGPAQPATSASNPYAPRTSMDRTSGEYSRGSIEMSRRSLDMQSGYSPARTSSPAQQYSPYGSGYNPTQESPRSPPVQQQPAQFTAATPGYQAYGYPGAPINGVIAGSDLPTPTSEKPPFEPKPEAPGTSGYQAPSYGYEPPSFTPYEAPKQEDKPTSDEAAGDGGCEPPSYQPYGYEPPSYQPDPPSNEDAKSDDEKPKPKKKSFMDDDDDDYPPMRPAQPAEKSKQEKDRENAEMFRKAAEEDAKRAEAAKTQKKGWGFGSWFGGKKADMPQQQEASGTPNKPIRAKLGEANSFYYDPELKRWVNKNASGEEAVKKATPPPPKAGPPGGAPRSATSSPLFPPQDMTGRVASAPPPRVASAGNLTPPGSASDTNLAAPPPGPVAMLRSASNTSTASAPPGGARPPMGGPAKSLSNSSSIDDLLGAVGPRRPGQGKKPRKSARYVDVMTKD
ncbi:putative COPII coat assembly protein sec-16 [Triangularia verruculosa]|uniref:Protein transport protein sec16 n=1 Tax=Triangularia verruculosa TaxID=2587418 RepID=A0AAN6XFX2_9PEZI|nr:putative COPII coat assembly protein sec-16 [Triangularia verruculosa]